MLLLPLLSDLLLLDHHRVGSLFVGLMPLLGLKKLVLEVSDLDVAFIVQLIRPAVEDDLESVQLRDGALLFVSQLVDELAEPLVVIEVALVVAHVRVKLDFLLMLQYSGLLPLILDHLQLFLELLVLSLEAADLLLTHGLLLVSAAVSVLCIPSLAAVSIYLCVRTEADLMT